MPQRLSRTDSRGCLRRLRTPGTARSRTRSPGCQVAHPTDLAVSKNWPIDEPGPRRHRGPHDGGSCIPHPCERVLKKQSVTLSATRLACTGTSKRHAELSQMWSRDLRRQRQYLAEGQEAMPLGRVLFDKDFSQDLIICTIKIRLENCRTTQDRTGVIPANLPQRAGRGAAPRWTCATSRSP